MSICNFPLSPHPYCRGTTTETKSKRRSQTPYSTHTPSCYSFLPSSRNRMGNCCSQPDDQEKEAAQRSAQIDRQIEQDGKKLKKECKILLLGKSSLSILWYLRLMIQARVNLASPRLSSRCASSTKMASHTTPRSHIVKQYTLTSSRARRQLPPRCTSLRLSLPIPPTR